MSLLLVEFAADFDYDEEGRRRERAIMRRRGEIPLGDRYRDAVTVNGDTITIETDRRGGRSARVIRVR